MSSVKLKGSAECLTLYVDMGHSKEKIREDLVRIIREAENFLGSSREVFVKLENSEQEDEDMGFLENLLQSLGINLGVGGGKRGKSGQGGVEVHKDVYSQGSTLLIRKHIRSGQKVEHDGTIVIIGDVKPGAEITAGAHVIIIGSLKGNVHAGAGGDPEAVIYASRFEPAIIKIGNLIAKAPEPASQDGGREAGAEIARIAEGQIVIEAV